MNKVVVIGTGPGTEEYMTPIGREAISQADLVVGGKRLLDTFAMSHQEQWVIGADLQDITHRIAEQYQVRNIAVLVSGDTGVFSFADYLARHIDQEALQFIPGISSVQVMFARLQKSWVNAQILSVHGREAGVVADVVANSPITAIVTGRPWFPAKLAAHILTVHPQLERCAVSVGVDLGYQYEKLIHTVLGELATSEEHLENSVMVIMHE